MYQLSEAASSFGKGLTEGDNSNYVDLIDIGLDNFYKAMLNTDNKEKII